MNILLFKICVKHSYFGDGIFEGCKILPDSATSEVIRRYGILMRMTNGIFAFYAPYVEEVTGFLDYLKMQLQGNPLTFFMVANEAQFAFITEVPPNWVGQVAMNSKSGTEEFLHEETRFKLIPGFANRKVRQSGVIGMISIYVDDLLKAIPKVVQYVVDFYARSLPWRYYLVNHSQIKLNRPVIRDQNQIYLDGPVPIVLPNGTKGMCFSSGERVFPLQQIPTLIFDLIDRLSSPMDGEGGTIEHCLIHGLPTPNMGDLKQEGSTKDVFGAMYVYL